MRTEVRDAVELQRLVAGESGEVALLPGAPRLVPAEGLGAAPDIIFLAGPESGARDLAEILPNG